MPRQYIHLSLTPVQARAVSMALARVLEATVEEQARFGGLLELAGVREVHRQLAARRRAPDRERAAVLTRAQRLVLRRACGQIRASPTPEARKAGWTPNDLRTLGYAQKRLASWPGAGRP
jgi:hypothetical protein